MIVQPGRMNPTASEPRADVLRPLLAAARTAWCRGNYDDCLSELDVVPNSCNPANAVIADALLLRSRARLRTNRAHAVVEELRPILDAFTDLDEACTAKMLYAAAIARAVDVHQGIELLDAADDAARKAPASVRAEIAYYKALALWTLRQYGQADALAQKTEAARVDVLSARAIELRAYCAIGLARHLDALKLFRAAHAAYNRCRDRDALLAAKIVLQIANLEQILRSARVPGSHGVPSARTFVGDTFGRSMPSFERMRTLQMDGWLYALDGNGSEAFRCLREAEQLAPSSAWRAGAMANRGLLASWFGERLSAKQHVTMAEAEARLVNWSEVGVREELVCLFALIEAMCAVETPAQEMMDAYDQAAAALPVEVLSAETINPSHAARVDYVRGLVRRSQGDGVAARELLMRAYQRFRSIGYLWRATLALIELDATPAPARGEFYLETAALLVSEHFQHSFLANRLGRWRKAYQDPTARDLTPAQREVLRYALDGYGAVEIGTLTGRAERTIRKHLTALHEAFNVDTTLRLVAVCHARGIGSPAWQSTSAIRQAGTG